MGGRARASVPKMGDCIGEVLSQLAKPLGSEQDDNSDQQKRQLLGAEVLH
jgi:hypothetical protein